MQLELNHDEWQELTELVRSACQDINPEIHHTRTPQYLDELHRRREILGTLLKRLEMAPATAT